MTVTTIPAYYSFIDQLAESMLRDDIQELKDTLVLLPNRRACRSLRQTLIKKSGGHSFILPRMMPVADLDVEDVILSPEWINQDILPPIPVFERQGILMQFIVKYGQVIGEKGYGQAAHAIQLSRELARLIDQIHWENLSFDNIHDLVPEDYAQHWQVTIDFLKIMTEYWPKILKDRGASDPAAWRRDLILSYAQKWQSSPPQTPIIAAGSTGSIPCTATLLNVVRKLPKGRVILPGLDQALSDEEWNNLEITHPQYGMANLLQLFNIERSDVSNEVQIHINPLTPLARCQLLSKAMQPSVVSDWKVPHQTASKALQHLNICEVKSQAEEAGIIALIMRKSLEDEHKTVALVTPDRSLVERVKTELKRWNLTPDDTGGQSLSNTPEGLFLLLLAEALVQQDSLLPLLKVLKHPFMGGEDYQKVILEFDKYECRTHRKLSDILQDKNLRNEAAAILSDFLLAKKPFDDFLDKDSIVFNDLLATHFSIATKITSQRLIQGEYAQDLINFWQELSEASHTFPNLSPKDYPALLRHLMTSISVRQPHGHHPRLFIFGPLEARTIKTDIMILGGLNEGSWPPLTETDPWLNRPMRSDYGLPLPERRIGLSAHDFVQAFCAAEVYCTRSTRINGTPTVPARWLQRIQTVLKASGQQIDTSAQPWLTWYQKLDEPAFIKPIARPSPCPPLSFRPKKLSVTQIEMWMRDPYALYAKKILKLEPLEDLECPLSLALKGMLIHEILDTFVKSGSSDLNELLKVGEPVFTHYDSHPEVLNFWWPRFKRIAEWFLEIENERRQTLNSSSTEITGVMELETTGGIFTVTAKADRIDLLKSGEVDIIDYKTGTLPAKGEIDKGFASQLVLEAAIASSGGFSSLGKRNINTLQYWRLRGGEPAGEVRLIKEEIARLIDEALSGLKSLVEVYQNPETPYIAQPRAQYALRYNPYAHLSRTQEWLRGDAS